MIQSGDERLTRGMQVNDEDLAQPILAYLAGRPQAMDGVEGIARWWILQQQVLVNVSTVARVLRRLTNMGLLEELGEGEQRRYCLKV
jgi:DNA-binding IclR family transcriptional regulator